MEKRDRGPQPLHTLLPEVLARYGYGQHLAHAAREEAWRSVVPESFRGFTRAGNIERGCLVVSVANSVVMQELMFQKRELIVRLQESLPEQSIKDLRFKIGGVDP